MLKRWWLLITKDDRIVDADRVPLHSVNDFERVQIVVAQENYDMLEAENARLRLALKDARQQLSHELGGTFYQRFLDRNLAIERGESQKEGQG